MKDLEVAMLKFLSQKEKELLDTAESFEELLEIALAVLGRMPKPIVQVCGPITTGGRGSAEENIKFFRAAAKLLLQKGHNVFGQMIFHDSMIRIMENKYSGDAYCMPILDIFYKGVFTSGHVSEAIFLPDWQSSKGACWERDAVLEHNIVIRDFPEEWLVEINID